MAACPAKRGVVASGRGGEATGGSGVTCGDRVSLCRRDRRGQEEGGARKRERERAWERERGEYGGVR